MYLVVNVENLKLHESSITMDDNEDVQIPIVDDFALEYLDELQEDAILNRRTRASRQGDVEYLRVGLEGYIQTKKNGWRLGE